MRHGLRGPDMPIARNAAARAGHAEGAARTTDGGRPLRGLLRLGATGGQEALASVFVAGLSPLSAFGAAAGAGLAAS